MSQNNENGGGDGGDGGMEGTPAEPLPLDWTQMGRSAAAGGDDDDDVETPATRIRYPQDVMEFTNEPDEDDTELIIVGTAGQKITTMGPDLHRTVNPLLTKLVFRSHLIKKMQGLSGLQHLELLELYDNQIEALEDLNGGEGGQPGCTLRVLDMSYNVIRDMEPVRFCPNLVEIYLANNKLKTIKGLSQLSKLRKIDLGANRIRVMDEEELSGLTNLEELWLGKNKIESISGLEKLTKLRRLDLQSNRLTAIENLTAQVDTLEELYFSHNGIDDGGASKPTGLALPFSQLSVLDLSRNRLTSTRPFAHLLELEELWISGNDIKSFDDVQPLSTLGTRDGACLEGVYLEFNPVAEEFGYRKRLAEIVPSLKQIDANMIRPHEFGSPSSGGGGGAGRAESVEVAMRRYQEEALAKAREQRSGT